MIRTLAPFLVVLMLPVAPQAADRLAHYEQVPAQIEVTSNGACDENQRPAHVLSYSRAAWQWEPFMTDPNVVKVRKGGSVRYLQTDYFTPTPSSNFGVKVRLDLLICGTWPDIAITSASWEVDQEFETADPEVGELTIKGSGVLDLTRTSIHVDHVFKPDCDPFCINVGVRDEDLSPVIHLTARSGRPVMTQDFSVRIPDSGFQQARPILTNFVGEEE